MRFAFGSLLLGSLVLLPARAQVVIMQGQEVQVITDEAPPEVPQAEAPAAPAPAPDKPAKSTARLEKLKKLEFDRRSSTILAAWANPPKPEASEAKPEEKAAAAGAAVAPGDGAKAAEAKPAEAADAEAAVAAGEAAPVADGAAPSAEVDPKKAEEALKDAKKAEAEAKKKKKAEEEAARKAAEAKALEAEIKGFQRDVTLGQWKKVESYLASLTEDEQKTAYTQLLTSLQKGPSQRPNVPQPGQPYLEKNRFSLADVLALADAAPRKLEKAELTLLGQILRQSLDQGHQLDRFLAELAPALGGENAPLDRRQLALILIGANEPLLLGDLLPSIEEAQASNDREALNLRSRFCLAKYEKEKKAIWLEQAWTVTQGVLAAGDVSDEAKKEAIERAVDIAPKIKKELGQVWLDESFTQRPERGVEILAAIGSAASTALQSKPNLMEERSRLLELQTTAAKALLAAAPERASEWAPELSLLASNWLREAQVTYQLDNSTSLGPRMQRDNYGNFYFFDEDGNVQQQQQGMRLVVIRTGPLLEMRPSDAWIALIDPSLRPRFQMIFAQLFLKVGEEAKAFPYIEELAATHPRPAQQLVDEFLRVWTKNHDPNAQRQRQNPYIYFYGFEERANGIPLTRSKQERNLRELGEWVARLHKLPVKVDVELLTGAFTTAHSAAEVYRLETIEGIFGRLADLEPATLAELVQRMRTNLATIWRDPAVQEDKKTKRRQQDIQAEIVRGYQLAGSTIERALADHPASWELWLAKAAIEHDENDYRHEFQKDPEYSTRRQAAFETFHKAADLYREGVETLAQDKETTKLHETWFYAALGACDLKSITHDKQLFAAEIPRVRDALAALPAERAERHTALFANALVTRMSSVAPGVKYRYAREGLAVTGDHKLVREVRAIHDYYADLVTEIQLRTSIDGSDRVGKEAPFGLRVDLRHTAAIERESGGFAKYLQNQNNMQFSWNYGRPTEDYRDKFEEAARTALSEHFEILSVTFNEPQAKSKAEAEYGWRVTPYAYLLLKPRGPQVDRIPPLRLDLDFLDTSGYAVLPVESAPLPIDASVPEADPRPFTKLSLVQTLDERQAKDGKLLLEIKASASGLVPPLPELLDVAPEGFTKAAEEDHGPAIVKFDEDGAAVTCERTWTVTLRAKEGLPERPKSFTFPKPRVETTTAERFRYVDADLAAVPETVSLERQWGEPRRLWPWAVALVALLGGGVWFASRSIKKPTVAPTARFKIPEPVTPFTVLGLLRDIEQRNGLVPAQHQEIEREIATIEEHYFGTPGERELDLQAIAERWVGQAR